MKVLYFLTWYTPIAALLFPINKEVDYYKNEYDTWKDKLFTVQEKIDAITSEDKQEDLTGWQEREVLAKGMTLWAREEMTEAKTRAAEEKKEAESKKTQAEKRAAEEKAEKRTVSFYDAELDEYSGATVRRSKFKYLEDKHNIYKIGSMDNDGKFQPMEKKIWILDFEDIEDESVLELRDKDPTLRNQFNNMVRASEAAATQRLLSQLSTCKSPLFKGLELSDLRLIRNEAGDRLMEFDGVLKNNEVVVILEFKSTVKTSKKGNHVTDFAKKLENLNTLANSPDRKAEFQAFSGKKILGVLVADLLGANSKEQESLLAQAEKNNLLLYTKPGSDYRPIGYNGKFLSCDADAVQEEEQESTCTSGESSQLCQLAMKNLRDPK